MSVGKLEIIIRAKRGTKLEEVLAMVDAIKKAHLDADIRVEVEV